MIFETDGFGDANENENIEEEEPPLSNVYVFERKPRTMNRVEVWLTLQCLVLRSKVSHARREHWRSASIATEMQVLLTNEANRRLLNEKEAKEEQERVSRQKIAQEKMMREAEAHAHGKNVHSNHHNGQQSGVVGSLGAIVEENKTVKEEDGKNEIVLDENGNPIPQQRHRPRVIVEVQGERGK